jgi:hypothetical protein
MKPKVFLKFNRDDPSAVVCLCFWLNLYQGYDVYIVCDLFDAKNDHIPDYLKPLLAYNSAKIINTDYSLGNEYTPHFKKRKRNMSSANLTCFSYLTKEDNCLWIIDADDTMFLSRDFEGLRTKLNTAEKYLLDNKLDGFSLDFYREHNDTWTFGVCLLDAKIAWKKISEVQIQELEELGLALNGDSIFDILGRKGTYKLKSFVFDEFAFQHIINNFPKLAAGIYWWKDRKLWDKPLKEDVISL